MSGKKKTLMFTREHGPSRRPKFTRQRRPYRPLPFSSQPPPVMKRPFENQLEAHGGVWGEHQTEVVHFCAF